MTAAKEHLAEENAGWTQAEPGQHHRKQPVFSGTSVSKCRRVVAVGRLVVGTLVLVRESGLRNKVAWQIPFLRGLGKIGDVQALFSAEVL